MSSVVRPLRPRLVIRVANDGSLDFAATADLEVVIVKAGWGRFRVFPSISVGIQHMRRLLADSVKPSGPAATPEQTRRVEA